MNIETIRQSDRSAGETSAHQPLESGITRTNKEEQDDTASPSTNLDRTETQRTGLDPPNRPSVTIRSLKEAAAVRERAERNKDVSKWLAHAYFSVSNPKEKPDHDIAAINIPGRDDLDGIAVGDRTKNQAKPGQPFFVEENKGQMVENDYKIILARRNWCEAPVLRSISSSCYQPQSSQAAIEKFARLYHDTESVTSRAATWGTRRRSLSSATDLSFEGVTSGNVLKVVGVNSKSSRLRPASILKELRDMVTRPSKSTSLKRPQSQQGHDTPHDGPSPGSRLALTGEVTNRGKSKMRNIRELHSIDEISPSLAGFQEHVVHLNPALAFTNQFLVDRISHQQVIRFESLLSSRLGHSYAGAGYPSGSFCVALGYSTEKLGPGDLKKGPAINLISNSDDEDATSTDGRVSDDGFPADVPKPPCDHFPAELGCKLCFQKKQFHKLADWTKYVIEIVKPFTCTWEGCKDCRTFTRKADWICHENESHRRLEWWECDMEDCGYTCPRRDTFVQHLVYDHELPRPRHNMTPDDIKEFGNKPDHQQTTERVQSCHKLNMALPASEPCRFCGEQFPTWEILTTHLAKHMEDIALPVLRLVDAKAQEIEADRVKDSLASLLQSFHFHFPTPTAMKRGHKWESSDSGCNMSATSITGSDDAFKSLDKGISQTASTFSSWSPYTEMLIPFSGVTSEASSPRLAKLEEADPENDESTTEDHDDGRRGKNQVLSPGADNEAQGARMRRKVCTGHLQRLFPFLSRHNNPLFVRLVTRVAERLQALQTVRSRHRRQVQHNECPSASLCCANDQCFRWKSPRKISDGFLSTNEDSTIPQETSIWVYGLDMPSSMRASLPVVLECPVCFDIQMFHSYDHWKTHIIADLAPYICMGADCQSVMPFQTYSGWVEHQNHDARLWRCNIGTCDQTGSLPDRLTRHLVQRHNFPDPAKTAILSNGAVSPTITTVRECLMNALPKADRDRVCAFCGIKLASRVELDLHQAQHMELVGLLMLNLLRNTEDDDLDLVPLKRANFQGNQGSSLSDGTMFSTISPLGVVPKTLNQRFDEILGSISSSPPVEPTSSLDYDSLLSRPSLGSAGIKENVVQAVTPLDAEAPPLTHEDDPEASTAEDALPETTFQDRDATSALEPFQSSVYAPKDTAIDEGVTESGRAQSTQSTDTISTNEDGSPGAKWWPNRGLRQVGVVQVRIERVSLSQNLKMPESSDESEWYSEDDEEYDHTGSQTHNMDQSGDDQQNLGPDCCPTQGQGEQNNNRPQSNKRKRQTLNNQGSAEGAGDDDGEQPNATANSSKTRGTEAGQRWACPFQAQDGQLSCLRRSKNNPKGGCGNISRLKQHLNRKHRLSFRCERCWRSFDTRQKMADHGAQAYPCELKEIARDERFMGTEAEGEVDQPCHMASAVDMWYHLFRHVIPGMRTWNMPALKTKFSPYYRPKEPRVIIPAVEVPASALQHDQETVAIGQQSFDDFGVTPVPPFQNFSFSVPAFGGDGIFNGEPCFSLDTIPNTVPNPTTLSERSIPGSFLMSNNVPSSSAFSGPSTGVSLVEPHLQDTHHRQNYDRLRAHNQKMQEESLKNVGDVAHIQGLVEELLHAGGLNDEVYSRVTDISSLLGDLKKRLVS